MIKVVKKGIGNYEEKNHINIALYSNARNNGKDAELKRVMGDQRTEGSAEAFVARDERNR